MAKYKAKPIVKEAVQWTGYNVNDVRTMVGKGYHFTIGTGTDLRITKDDKHVLHVSKGMFIVIESGKLTTYNEGYFNNHYALDVPLGIKWNGNNLDDIRRLVVGRDVTVEATLLVRGAAGIISVPEGCLLTANLGVFCDG